MRRTRQHPCREALREAQAGKLLTNPDEAVEGRIADLAAPLLEEWDRDAPAALTRLLERGQALILAQLMFKMVMRAFPT